MKTIHFLYLFCLLVSSNQCSATRSFHGSGGVTWRQWKKEHGTPPKECKQICRALKLKTLQQKKGNRPSQPVTPYSTDYKHYQDIMLSPQN